MRSSVDRHARPITIAILSAYVLLIAGSQFLGLHHGGPGNGQSPAQSAGQMFDNIVACSYFVFAASLVLLISRSRKNFFLNWVVGSLGVFFLAEGLSHALNATSYCALHPWILRALEIVSAAAGVLTVGSLPAAIRRIRATLREASRSIESKSRLIAASESSIDAIFLFEAVRSENEAMNGAIVDFRFTFLNHRGAAWFGKEREELLGKNL